MIIYSIYKATNQINGKSYIGFASYWPQRKTSHKHLSKKYQGNNNLFYSSIRKYGWDNFEWKVLYQSLNKEHCKNEMESYFIKEYDTYNNGYNMTTGGEGTFGWAHPPEVYARIAEGNKGNVPWNKGLSGYEGMNKGWKYTEEQLDNRKILSKKIYRGHMNKSVECEHCSKSISVGNYARWHGQNCKLYKEFYYGNKIPYIRI